MHFNGRFLAPSHENVNFTRRQMLFTIAPHRHSSLHCPTGIEIYGGNSASASSHHRKVITGLQSTNVPLALIGAAATSNTLSNYGQCSKWQFGESLVGLGSCDAIWLQVAGLSCKWLDRDLGIFWGC